MNNGDIWRKRGMKKRTRKGIRAVFESATPEPKATGSMDVDGTKMRLFERPVKLGKRVAVIDAKTAKEIGYVDGEKVFELLNGDGRYEAYDDPATGAFVLAYTSEPAGSLAVESEADDVFGFLKTVEGNLGTAIGADDPKRLRLGVSYERNGKKYVMFLRIKTFKGSAKFVSKGVRDAICGSGSGGDGGPTERLIRLLKKEARGKR